METTELNIFHGTSVCSSCCTTLAQSFPSDCKPIDLSSLSLQLVAAARERERLEDANGCCAKCNSFDFVDLFDIDGDL